MSRPTCCCSESLDRCDRCDLLVGLDGFHLTSVARTPDALMLDIESCDRCAGCPGCGVIAQGHGRVVVEVIDAPWAGVPARIRWHKRHWICREHTCETVTFLERSEKVCAPINTRGKPGAHTKPDAALSSGGIALHGGPTRRRHAVRRLHVVQNPHHFRLEGRRIAYKTGRNVDWREKVRPARPLQRHFREKVRPTRLKTAFFGRFGHAGRTFSRSRTHQGARGELFRAQDTATCRL